MDLKEFVSASLSQIAEGIIDANDKLKDKGAYVNPNGVQAYSNDAKAYGRLNADFKDHLPLVELVNFDVAVQVESGSQAGGGLKISIASIGVGAEGSSSESHSSASRIRFRVPMVYPQAKAV